MAALFVESNRFEEAEAAGRVIESGLGARVDSLLSACSTSQSVPCTTSSRAVSYSQEWMNRCFSWKKPCP